MLDQRERRRRCGNQPQPGNAEHDRRGDERRVLLNVLNGTGGAHEHGGGRERGAGQRRDDRGPHPTTAGHTTGCARGLLGSV